MKKIKNKKNNEKTNNSTIIILIVTINLSRSYSYTEHLTTL